MARLYPNFFLPYPDFLDFLLCDFGRERLCFEPEDSESESEDSELSVTDLECFFFFRLRSAIVNCSNSLHFCLFLLNLFLCLYVYQLLLCFMNRPFQLFYLSVQICLIHYKLGFSRGTGGSNSSLCCFLCHL